MFGCIAAKLTTQEEGRTHKFILERAENSTIICKADSLAEIELFLSLQGGGYKLEIGATGKDRFGCTFNTCAITRIDGAYGVDMDMLELTIDATYTTSVAILARRNEEYRRNMRLDNATRFAQLHPELSEERTLAFLAVQNRAYRAMHADLDKELDDPRADPPIYYSARTRAYYRLEPMIITGADMYDADEIEA